MMVDDAANALRKTQTPQPQKSLQALPTTQTSDFEHLRKEAWSVTDRERAGAYHFLITGSREPNEDDSAINAALPRVSVGEMLASLHRYLRKSHPVLPVKDYASDMITQEFMRIMQGASFMDDERTWLWEELFCNGVIYNSDETSKAGCGLPLIRFYSMLCAEGANYPDLVLPPYLIFGLMAWYTDADLFDWDKTSTGWVITPKPHAVWELKLQGKVHVPFRYFPADMMSRLADQRPFACMEFVFKRIVMLQHGYLMA